MTNKKMKVIKKSAIAAVVILLLIAGYNLSQNKTKEYPSPNVFTLEVSCEENVPVGKATAINYTLRNAGENDYEITSHNSLFHVFVDGKPVRKEENSTTVTKFFRGEISGQTISIVPDKAGTLEIKVTADFDVRCSSTEGKKYSYQKTVNINATK